MSGSDTGDPPTLLRGLAGLAAGLAVLAAGALIWAWLAPVAFWSLFTPEPQGPQLTVAQAHEQALAGEILLVDIRRPDEWRRTGIGQGAQPFNNFCNRLCLVSGGYDHRYWLGHGPYSFRRPNDPRPKCSLRANP